MTVGGKLQGIAVEKNKPSDRIVSDRLPGQIVSYRVPTNCERCGH